MFAFKFIIMLNVLGQIKLRYKTIQKRLEWKIMIAKYVKWKIMHNITNVIMITSKTYKKSFTYQLK